MTIVRSGYVRTLTSLEPWSGLHVRSPSHSSSEWPSNLYTSVRLRYSILFESVLYVSAKECPLTMTPASYPHIQCPRTGERRVLLPTIHHLCHSHHMHRIPLPSKHHAPPRVSRDRHRIVPSFHLFPGLFHQGFLGRTPARRGSRKEKLPESRTGSPRRWDMDLHYHLHIVEIDTGPLHPGIL